MDGLLETIQTILDFLKNSGVGEIIDIGTLGTLITTIVVSLKTIKKNTSDLIIAQSEKIQMSKEQKETKKEIDDIKTNQESIDEKLTKLTGMMLILFNNSKISSEAKQQALDVFHATTKEIKNVTEKVTDVVEKVQKQVEENVALENANKTEVNPYLENVEKLINER